MIIMMSVHACAAVCDNLHEGSNEFTTLYTAVFLSKKLFFIPFHVVTIFIMDTANQGVHIMHE